MSIHPWGKKGVYEGLGRNGLEDMTNICEALFYNDPGECHLSFSEYMKQLWGVEYTRNHIYILYMYIYIYLYTCIYIYMGVSINGGYPQIIHFRLGFPMKQTYGGSPFDGNPQASVESLGEIGTSAGSMGLLQFFLSLKPIPLSSTIDLTIIYHYIPHYIPLHTIMCHYIALHAIMYHHIP